uniref:Uncharacterized protein n=1 Tax=Anguilla anguilla TaxID=7936 RepID=A0A0E9PFJ5_ANGAN
MKYEFDEYMIVGNLRAANSVSSSSLSFVQLPWSSLASTAAQQYRREQEPQHTVASMVSKSSGH